MESFRKLFPSNFISTTASRLYSSSHNSSASSGNADLADISSINKNESPSPSTPRFKKFNFPQRKPFTGTTFDTESATLRRLAILKDEESSLSRERRLAAIQSKSSQKSNAAESGDQQRFNRFSFTRHKFKEYYNSDQQQDSDLSPRSPFVQRSNFAEVNDRFPKYRAPYVQKSAKTNLAEFGDRQHQDSDRMLKYKTPRNRKSTTTTLAEFGDHQHQNSNDRVSLFKSSRDRKAKKNFSESDDPDSSNRSRPIDNYAISIWAQRMAQQGRVREALRFIENKLMHPPASNPSASRSIVLYNTAISICAKEGDVEDALRFFRMAKTNGVAWNGRSIASLIHSMVRAVELGIPVETIEDRLRFFDRAVQLAREYIQSFGERREGWRDNDYDDVDGGSVCGGGDHLDSYAYNALINLACRLGRLTDASRLLEPSSRAFADLRPPTGPDAYSFTTVYYGLANLGGTFTDGVRFLKLQEAAGIPRDTKCLLAILTLAKADLRRYEWDGDEVAADSSTTTGKTRTAHMAQLAQIEVEMRALEADSSKWPNAFHSLILECWISLRACEEARRYIASNIEPILDQTNLIESSRHRPRPFPFDTFLAATLLRVPLRSGRLDQVFPWYERMCKAGLRKLPQASTHLVNLLFETCARNQPPWGRRALSFYDGIFGISRQDSSPSTTTTSSPLPNFNPDHHTFKWMSMALKGDPAVTEDERNRYLRDIQARIMGEDEMQANEYGKNIDYENDNEHDEDEED